MKFLAATRAIIGGMETSSASSSANIIADIIRLIPSTEHAAFRDMLAHETRGRVLPNGELRPLSFSRERRSSLSRNGARWLTAQVSSMPSFVSCRVPCIAPALLTSTFWIAG